MRSKAVQKFQPFRRDEAFPVIHCRYCGRETWCLNPAAVRRCAGCGKELKEETHAK